MEAIINDVVGILRGTFLSGDWIDILIAVIAVGAAAIMMRRSSQIGSMTLLALVLFMGGCFLRGVIARAGGGAVDPTGATMGQVEASWTRFMAMPAGALLAYFLAFMVAILAVFCVKILLARR